MFGRRWSSLRCVSGGWPRLGEAVVRSEPVAAAGIAAARRVPRQRPRRAARARTATIARCGSTPRRTASASSQGLRLRTAGFPLRRSSEGDLAAGLATSGRRTSPKCCGRRRTAIADFDASPTEAVLVLPSLGPGSSRVGPAPSRAASSASEQCQRRATGPERHVNPMLPSAVTAATEYLDSVDWLANFSPSTRRPIGCGEDRPGRR